MWVTAWNSSPMTAEQIQICCCHMIHNVATNKEPTTLTHVYFICLSVIWVISVYFIVVLIKRGGQNNVQCFSVSLLPVTLYVNMSVISVAPPPPSLLSQKAFGGTTALHYWSRNSMAALKKSCQLVSSFHLCNNFRSVLVVIFYSTLPEPLMCSASFTVPHWFYSTVN